MDLLSELSIKARGLFGSSHELSIGLLAVTRAFCCFLACMSGRVFATSSSVVWLDTDSPLEEQSVLAKQSPSERYCLRGGGECPKPATDLLHSGVSHISSA